MFKKVLIANRGEIALRVIRACRELGLETVAVYSEADRESLHVRFADDDVCIGPPPSRSSYLKIPNIIAAAEITGADAIHPGYGFLAENAEFADTCKASNITFIGPTGDQIRQMGDKATARRLAAEAGVPTVPGSPGTIEDPDEALAFAESIGFPVIIKATAGGGGKGMRIAHEAEQFPQLFGLAQNEALAAFDNGAVYVEKYIQHPRHVEIQVMGDNFGKVVHLGERDCSVQRRHQKLIEESPSPALDADAARPDGPGGRGAGLQHRLRRRRHARVPARHRRVVLLHGDEHPDPGGAPGDRDGHQLRPGEGADPGGRRRADQLPGRRPAAARPRHRVPHQRRGSLPELPAVARGSSPPTIRRAARACGWTRTSTPATPCRRTTTRCWPR